MYVGVDLGGTNIAAGIVDENGTILYEKTEKTRVERPACEVISSIAALVIKTIEGAGLDKSEIKALGIGIPGLVDKDGNVIFCVNLGWRDIPIKKLLEEHLQLPVYMGNDATVAALSEYELGSMKGCQSGVMLTLGTGVGGGIIINGQIYSGFNGVGSELGHIIVGKNSYNCNCGSNGCLETFASSTAIIRYTKELLEKSNKASLIYEKLNGNIDNLDAKIIFDCAKEGDAVANIAVKHLAKYLSRGIISIINFMDPEVIALGGGVAEAGDFLLNRVTEQVNKNKYYKTLPSAKIVLATLGNKAGIIGAASIAKPTYNYINLF